MGLDAVLEFLGLRGPAGRRGKRLELRFVTYKEGDRLIKLGEGWDIAIPEEDRNKVIGMVWVEKIEMKL